MLKIRCILICGLFAALLCMLWMVTYSRPRPTQCALVLSHFKPTKLKEFKYSVKIGNLEKKGDSLLVEEWLLKHIKLPPKNYVQLLEGKMDNVALVIAASDNHFKESEDAVASVQTHFPKHDIVYYDLGLTEQQVAKLRTWCGVEHKIFNFSLYPPHLVCDLRTCSWKPVIIHEVLQRYDGVVWFDASARFLSSNLSAAQNVALKSGGMAIFLETGHSIYAATAPKTFDYLVTDQEKTKSRFMIGAGAVLAYRTREIYENVLFWWILCSLNANCLAPIDAFECHFDGMDKFAKCHRYDQSALNILLTNRFSDINSYHAPEKGLVDIERYPTNKYTLQTC